MGNVSTTLVLAAPNEAPWMPATWRSLLRQLPACLQEYTLEFQKWEDRQATVLGKHLLRRGLTMLGHDPQRMQAMQWDLYQKPYLCGLPNFNISHTKGLVVCALQAGGRVGIDVELKWPVDIEDYREVFTPTEYNLIAECSDPIDCFFNFWTRKEALMKADGRGFHLSPKVFEAISDRVRIGAVQWQLKKVPLPDGFVCHLALEQEAQLNLQFLHTEDLM